MWRAPQQRRGPLSSLHSGELQHPSPHTANISPLTPSPRPEPFFARCRYARASLLHPIPLIRPSVSVDALVPASCTLLLLQFPCVVAPTRSLVLSPAHHRPPGAPHAPGQEHQPAHRQGLHAQLPLFPGRPGHALPCGRSRLWKTLVKGRRRSRRGRGAGGGLSGAGGRGRGQGRGGRRRSGRGRARGAGRGVRAVRGQQGLQEQPGAQAEGV